MRAVIESEGIEVIGVRITDHVKFDVVYQDREFIIVAGQNNPLRNRRKMMAFRSDVRRAKKAVETGDMALVKKYLGVHE